jgi:hypothetical protein
MLRSLTARPTIIRQTKILAKSIGISRFTGFNGTITERFRAGAARRTLRRYKLNFSECDIPRYGWALRGSAASHRYGGRAALDAWHHAEWPISGRPQHDRDFRRDVTTRAISEMDPNHDAENLDHSQPEHPRRHVSSRSVERLDGCSRIEPSRIIAAVLRRRRHDLAQARQQHGRRIFYFDGTNVISALIRAESRGAAGLELAN